MSVRAKFTVGSIMPHNWGTEISMHPVYSEDPNSENKRFWDATPNGSLNMTLKNDAAAKYFKQGKEYYIDFTEVEQATASTEPAFASADPTPVPAPEPPPAQPAS